VDNPPLVFEVFDVEFCVNPYPDPKLLSPETKD